MRKPIPPQDRPAEFSGPWDAGPWSVTRQWPPCGSWHRAVQHNIRTGPAPKMGPGADERVNQKGGSGADYIPPLPPTPTSCRRGTDAARHRRLLSTLSWQEFNSFLVTPLPKATIGDLKKVSPFTRLPEATTPKKKRKRLPLAIKAALTQFCPAVRQHGTQRYRMLYNTQIYQLKLHSLNSVQPYANTEHRDTGCYTLHRFSN